MNRLLTACLSAPFLAACAAAPTSTAPPAATCADLDPPLLKPPYSGAKPVLPPPAAYAAAPLKVGDAYTVRGAMRRLRSRAFSDEVVGKRITIIGWIVKTNYDAAPACALHRTGKGDPPDCRAPVPSFSIADEKGELTDAMDVMGWASNFAQIFTLVEAIQRAPAGKSAAVRLDDEFWGTPLPNPVPSVGARVKVTGSYGITFTKATGGAAADAKHGILTADRIEMLEPAPQAAVLPGRKGKS